MHRKKKENESKKYILYSTCLFCSKTLFTYSQIKIKGKNQEDYSLYLKERYLECIYPTEASLD